MRIALTIALMALVPFSALSDQPIPPFANYDLSDERLLEAIEQCPVNRSRFDTGPGLSLRDSKSDKWAASITARVYTPYSWICREAIEANRKFTPLTLNDLTDEMKRPVLRVRASPGQLLHDPNKVDLDEYGMIHITIRSTAKKDYAVLEPISVEVEEGGPKEVAVGEWGTGKKVLQTFYPARLLLFDLEQVAEISKLDKKGEVFIAFENALGKERKLKIKSKHFEKLP